MNENIEESESYMPRRTFIVSGMCMMCGGFEDVKTYPIRTMMPRHEYNVCDSAECARKLKKGYASFLRSGEIIMVETPELHDNCSVRRSNGDVDNDWSVMGFVSEAEGVRKVLMSKNEITKCIVYEQFAHLNPHLTPVLNKEIEEFFTACFCTVKNIFHDAI